MNVQEIYKKMSDEAAKPNPSQLEFEILYNTLVDELQKGDNDSVLNDVWYMRNHEISDVMSASSTSKIRREMDNAVEAVRKKLGGLVG